MADKYIQVVDAISRDPTTHLANIPRDIVNIIRRMYPETYSFEHIEGLLHTIMETVNNTYDMGEQDSRYYAIRFQPEYRELLLREEMHAQDKADWWARRYFICCHKQHLRKSIPELAKQIHGEEFWDQVVTVLYEMYNA